MEKISCILHGHASNRSSFSCSFCKKAEPCPPHFYLQNKAESHPIGTIFKSHTGHSRGEIALTFFFDEVDSANLPHVALETGTFFLPPLDAARLPPFAPVTGPSSWPGLTPPICRSFLRPPEPPMPTALRPNCRRRRSWSRPGTPRAWGRTDPFAIFFSSTSFSFIF